MLIVQVDKHLILCTLLTILIVKPQSMMLYRQILREEQWEGNKRLICSYTTYFGYGTWSTSAVCFCPTTGTASWNYLPPRHATTPIIVRPVFSIIIEAGDDNDEYEDDGGDERQVGAPLACSDQLLGLKTTCCCATLITDSVVYQVENQKGFLFI